MQFNHRNNDLQLFYDRPGPQLTPNRKRTPTPIKIGSMRMLPTKENMPKSNSSRSINDFNNNKNELHNRKNKPMISPSRNPYPEKKFFLPEERFNQRNYQLKSMLEPQHKQKHCPNHINKLAEFMIQIQDEHMLYCQKCAAQLASQGFEVTRLENNTVKKGDYAKKTNKRTQPELPNYPEYEGSKMYGEIICFLKELNSIEEEHQENMEKFQEIDNHYNKQIKITQNFYDQLLKTIEVMKEDHLSDLIEESRRHSQIADIEHDYLRENVDEMDIIRKDIENNLEVIMEKLEEDQLYENLNEYRQKIQVFRHKAEEQTDIFQQIISYTQEELTSKQSLVQDYLMEVWAEKENKPKSYSDNKYSSEQPKPPKNKQNMNLNHPSNQNNPVKNLKAVMQVGQKKPQTNANVNPPAFRKLFEDEDNALVSETSPQFKKI